MLEPRNSTETFGSVYIRLDQNLVINTKVNYGLLDWIAAVGGLSSCIITVMGIISNVLSY